MTDILSTETSVTQLRKAAGKLVPTLRPAARLLAQKTRACDMRKIEHVLERLDPTIRAMLFAYVALGRRVAVLNRGRNPANVWSAKNRQLTQLSNVDAHVSFELACAFQQAGYPFGDGEISIKLNDHLWGVGEVPRIEQPEAIITRRKMGVPPVDSFTLERRQLRKMIDKFQAIRPEIVPSLQAAVDALNPVLATHESDSPCRSTV
jgi:hypothetical protein